MLLSIDPGLTTGWVYFSSAESVAEIGEWTEHELAEAVQPWASSSRCDVVIESLPALKRGQLGRRLKAVVDTLERSFPEATWILPGTYKAVPTQAPITLPKPLTSFSKHERDALRLGLYYLQFVRREET